MKSNTGRENCNIITLYSPHLKMVLFFFGCESLSEGYNVLNEFMFQPHMRFCRMQWSATRFCGSLSVYSALPPPPSEKNSPFAAQLKIAFRRFLFPALYVLNVITRGLVLVCRMLNFQGIVFYIS